MSKKLYILLFSFSCPFLYGQQIDPSILSQLSPEQIQMAKEAYAESNSTDAEITEMPPIEESLEVKEVEDSNMVAGKKFGYSFFSSIPTSTSAVGDLPLPNDYKISIRDQFTVILSGSRESIFDLNVKLDGTILFPEIGSVSVVGETFGEVKEKLSNLINQSYIGVQIDLSIKNLSAKKITIVGAVKSPGTYLVNPFSTISSALAYSGGISEIGTLRDIKLIRNNGRIFTFDLYNLLINADRSDDITIEAGDTILINAASQFVDLTGSINRPAIYEVIESETLEDLINFGLGFKPTSNKSKISLSTLDLQNKKLNQTETDDLSINIRNIDSVTVFDYISEVNSNIYVSGAVSEPGYYNSDEFSILEDLINNIEFVDVYPWLGVLEQFNKEDLLTEIILFSLVDPMSYKSIKILPNSTVYFLNLFDTGFNQVSDKSKQAISDFTGFDQVSDKSKQAISDFSLKINHHGETYSLPVYGKYSLSSFVNFLGLDMSDVSYEATYVSPLENKIVVEDYRNMIFNASKYNTVSFKSKTNDLINVTIGGSIEFPGTYSLNSNSTLADLYKIVGDFKDMAFHEGIVFKRELVRDRQIKAIKQAKESLNESILVNMQNNGGAPINSDLLTALATEIDPDDLGRIAGNFSPTSESATNTILYDGDSIYIPIKSNSISVLGEVLNPNNFIYENRLTVREAIEYAGGFKGFADQKSVYVIQANGLVIKANRNVFGSNKFLEAGDTVIVPRKLRVDNPISKTITPITQILSDLAFSAAAIDNLSSN